MQETHQRIVVGVDGSAGSLDAVAWAADAARLREAPLRLIHVLDLGKYVAGWPEMMPLLEDLSRDARSVLDAAESGIEGVEVESDVVEGAPAKVLLTEARSSQLVVVGSRGHHALRDQLLGSTSLQVAMHAACPVVVVRETHDRDEDGAPPGRVVVGVDGSALSDAAVELAFAEADRRGVGLTAVHAWQWTELSIEAIPYPAPHLAEEHARAVLAERLADCTSKYPDVAVVQRTVRGDAVGALVAESAGAVLTVVGSRGSGGFTGLLLGSVSHSVLHRAHSPVAVARTHH